MYFQAALLFLAVFGDVVFCLPSNDDTAQNPEEYSNRTANHCQAACTILSATLQGRVSLPQSTVYTAEQVVYWSLQQSTVTPTCRVTPSCAEDVSTTLQVLKAQSCRFAVKSGGHASFAGSSNIEDGVTIDFSNMKELTISEDRTQVSIGPGNHWSEVYLQLDAAGLGVIGGRVASIGTGGLTLGGGISYFSGRYGWACDNVNNYQVVFADGSIRDVNQKSNPDLYFALRGGGNNFGIVTRFDLASFEQGKMWGGQFTYSADYLPALLDAFVTFNINHEEDPYGAVIVSSVYVPSYREYLVSVDLEYGKPVANPPILENFTAIPTLDTSARITNLTDLTLELDATQPVGLRKTFWTFTVCNDAALLSDINTIWRSEVAKIVNVTNVLPALVFQPLSTAITSHFSQNGGNALGITAEDGPLALINTSVAWSNSTDDDKIMAYARNIVSRSIALAKERGLFHKYIYQNYASIEQDVFSSYGSENKARLQSIHAKYDPEGVFTKLQPGYFKIS